MKIQYKIIIAIIFLFLFFGLNNNCFAITDYSISDSNLKFTMDSVDYSIDMSESPYYSKYDLKNYSDNIVVFNNDKFIGVYFFPGTNLKVEYKTNDIYSNFYFLDDEGNSVTGPIYRCYWYYSDLSYYNSFSHTYSSYALDISIYYGYDAYSTYKDFDELINGLAINNYTFYLDGELFLDNSTSIVKNYDTIQINIKNEVADCWDTFYLESPVNLNEYNYIIFMDSYFKDTSTKNTSARFSVSFVHKDSVDVLGNSFYYNNPDVYSCYDDYNFYFGNAMPYMNYYCNYVYSKDSPKYVINSYELERNYSGVSNGTEYSTATTDTWFFKSNLLYTTPINYNIGNFLGSNSNIYYYYTNSFWNSFLNNFNFEKVYDYKERYSIDSNYFGTSYNYSDEYWAVLSYTDTSTPDIDYTGEIDNIENIIDNTNTSNTTNDNIISIILPNGNTTNTNSNPYNNFTVNNNLYNEIISDKVKESDDTSTGGFLSSIFSALGSLLEGIAKGFSSIVETIGNAINFIFEGIKNLFIPSGDYLSNFVNDGSEYLNDHLGLVYQPIDISIGLFNRYNNINFVDPIIYIPEIKVPLTDYTLLSPINFNFNTILKNDVFNNVHEIYLVSVDVMLLFVLLNKLNKIAEEVFSK